MKDVKIKLTFQRVYNKIVTSYQLVQIENAVTAVFDSNGNKSTHRVGDVVPESTVQEFVGIKRDYLVKVKS